MKTRPGRTVKVSVSLDHEDLAILRRYAERVYGGNLSAVIADSARLIEEEEGRRALVEWLGEAAATTPEQRRAIRQEWRPAAATRSRRRAS